MAIVTISRELGTGGTEIAEAVARAFNGVCVDKEVLAEMARHAGVTVEVMAHEEERLLAKPMFVSDEMRALSSAQRKPQGAMTEAAFVQQLTEVIKELAERDNIVFIGRGAQIILKDHPTALHVHLYASANLRAARLHQRGSAKNLVEAERKVKQADEQRREWFRHFFAGADWKRPHHYHLMIDTGRIPYAVATALIVQAAQSTSTH